MRRGLARVNMDDADPNEIVARREQESRRERKQKIPRLPSFRRSTPGERDDSGDDGERTQKIGHAGSLVKK